MEGGGGGNDFLPCTEQTVRLMKNNERSALQLGGKKERRKKERKPEGEKEEEEMERKKDIRKKGKKEKRKEGRKTNKAMICIFIFSRAETATRPEDFFNQHILAWRLLRNFGQYPRVYFGSVGVPPSPPPPIPLPLPLPPPPFHSPTPTRPRNSKSKSHPNHQWIYNYVFFTIVEIVCINNSSQIAHIKDFKKRKKKCTEFHRTPVSYQ